MRSRIAKLRIFSLMFVGVESLLIPPMIGQTPSGAGQLRQICVLASTYQKELDEIEGDRTKYKKLNPLADDDFYAAIAARKKSAEAKYLPEVQRVLSAPEFRDWPGELVTFSSSGDSVYLRINVAFCQPYGDQYHAAAYISIPKSSPVLQELRSSRFDPKSPPHVVFSGKIEQCGGDPFSDPSRRCAARFLSVFVPGYVVQLQVTPTRLSLANASPADLVPGRTGAGNLDDGTVLKPTLSYKVEPKYTERARAARVSCDVKVDLVVTAQGSPQEVRVSKPCAESIVRPAPPRTADGPAAQRVGAWRAELEQVTTEARLFRKRAESVGGADRDRLLERARELEARATTLVALIASAGTQLAAERRSAEDAYRRAEYDYHQAIDTSKDLDDNAVVAVQQWRFHPGTKNGQPVDVRADATVNFRLH